MTCKEVARLVSEMHDRKVLFPERLKLYIHLFICRLCDRYKRQIFFVQKAIRRSRQAILALYEDEKHVLPDSVKERIKKAAREKMDGC